MKTTSSYSPLSSVQGETLEIDTEGATVGDIILRSTLTVAGFIVGNIIVEVVKYKWLTPQKNNGSE